MKKQAILITGGAGYIGSHAAKLFLERGYRVVIFDNLSRGWRAPIETLKKYGELEFTKGDLRSKKDIAKVFKKFKIDGVLHFAALCSVNESMEHLGLYFENNVLGSLNLLEAMRGAGVKKIIFSSTCAVYGETKYLPVDENHPKNPENPYGESKLMVERMLEWYGKIHSFNFTILRYFNVCGAASDGVIGDSKKPSLLLMQNAVRGAMGIEPFSYTCQQVKTKDGTPIRDYIDVEDLAEAHHAAWKYLGKGGKNDIFNLGNEKGYSVREIVTEVERTFGKVMKKKKSVARKGEYAAIYADTRKAQQALSWKSEKSLKNSIESLRRWYEKHPNGYSR